MKRSGRNNPEMRMHRLKPARVYTRPEPERVLELSKQGKNATEIATMLGCPRSCVARILSKPQPKPRPKPEPKRFSKDSIMAYIENSKGQYDETEFTPKPIKDCMATDAPAGSPEKIAVLRWRAENGFEMFSRCDRADYEGLSGAIKPRE